MTDAQRLPGGRTPSETSTDPVVPAGSEPPRTAIERFVSPSMNAVVLAVMVLVGVVVGMAPLQDNSFLTHLATGRLILDDWSVPTADPYSWTAHGDPWTVQSWLASVIYAGLEETVGLIGVRVLSALLVAAVTVGLWKLTEPAEGLLARSLAIALPVMVGASMWVERPYMFGVLGLVLVLLAADGRLDPRWLVPILWLWANTHGSFPFAPAILTLMVIGRFLDERRRPDVELRCLGWTVFGIAASMVGPLGTKVLTFPFEMLENREVFLEVREWKPLDFSTSYGRLFAVQLLVTLVAVVRVRRWRAVLPALVFGVAAVTSARNVVQASVVVTPIIAAGFAGLGSLKGTVRPRLARPLLHGVSVVIVVMLALQLPQDDTDLELYPREAASWMRGEGLMDTSSQVLSRELVGNYLAYAYGPDEVRIFIDDRVDMFPAELVKTYLALLEDDGDHAAVVDELNPTAILWERDSGLARWVASSQDWQVVWEDETWLVAVPT